MTDMMTVAEFAAKNGIRFSHEYAANNPNMDPDGSRMDNYKCRLRCKGKAMTVYFSKGLGLGGKPPEVDEVLDCLASDASGAENAGSFEEWCSEYGYDTDSRKAERTYRTIEKQAAKLKALLGDAAYEQLLYHCERL